MNISKENLKQLFLIFFSFSIILSIMLFSLDRYIKKNHQVDIAIANAPAKIVEKKEFIDYFLDESVKTLESINALSTFQNYLQNKDIPSQKNLTDLFYSFAYAKNDFMQIRYIDKNGFEKIRIDRNKAGEKPFVVEQNKLQNKADRYYFSDSIHKTPNKVWFSALDLNIEHGKVEIPYKPTLRAVMPIFANNQFEGILIINYFMEHFLEHLASNRLYNVIIYNNKGYPLYHFEGEKSWSFYKLGQWNLKDEYGDFYQDLITKDLITNEKFVAAKLSNEIQDQFYMLFQANPNAFKDDGNSLVFETIKNLAITFIFSIIMTLIVVKFFNKTILNLEETQKLNKQLNLISLKNEVALRATGVGIWEWNIKTNRLIWDNQMYNIYGVEKIQNESPYELWSNRIDPTMRSLVESHLKLALETRGEYDISFWIIKPSGERRFVKALGIIEYDSNNQPYKMIGTNQDITKTKQLTDQLSNMNRELEIQVQEAVKNIRENELKLFEQSKLSSLGEMIGNIAHQWRQPLTAISMSGGGLAIMNEYKKWDYEKAKNFLDGIDTNVHYLSDTIDIFKNFIKEKKEKGIVKLGERIDILVNIIGSTLKNKNIDLIVDLPKTPIEFETIVGELDQVLINIINNAQDILIERSIQNPQIKINAFTKDEMIYINISDNGGGIPDEILPKIFEPYFTTKHKSRGTGLGLHMSYIIITQSLKGTIYATNDSYGAVFHIELHTKLEADNTSENNREQTNG